MSKNRQQHQISITGELYAQIKAKADAEGVTLGTIIERAISPILGTEPTTKRKPRSRLR